MTAKDDHIKFKKECIEMGSGDLPQKKYNAKN